MSIEENMSIIRLKMTLCTLSGLLITLSSVQSEWVDLPQFSDEDKVYRYWSNFRKVPNDERVVPMDYHAHFQVTNTTENEIRTTTSVPENATSEAKVMRSKLNDGMKILST